MSPLKTAIKKLKEAGYVLKRHGKHDQYYNPKLKKLISLKMHDFNDNDLKYIIKEIKQNEERRG